MSVPPSYPAPDPYQPAPASAGSSLDKLTPSNLLWAQAIGGIVAVFSVFLPWFSASGMGMTESANGFQSYEAPVGDDLFSLQVEKASNTWAGLLVLLLGLAIAAIAFTKVRGIQVPALQTLPPALPLALSGGLVLIAVIKLISILGDGGSFGGEEIFGQQIPPVSWGSGFGIWLLLIASLVTFAAAVLPMVKKKA